MQVWIKYSKTDSFRKGVDLGQTHNCLCPIMAMMAYLPVRGDTGGPLFHFKDGKPLTRDCFVNFRITCVFAKVRTPATVSKLVLLLQLPNTASKMPLFNSLVDGRAPPTWCISKLLRISLPLVLRLSVPLRNKLQRYSLITYLHIFQSTIVTHASIYYCV